MAAQVRLIRISWENDVNFKMDTKLDSDPYTTIIDMDENGHLTKLWDAGVRQLCCKFFEEEIDTVGADMKA